jgi:hypothetical protein
MAEGKLWCRMPGKPPSCYDVRSYQQLSWLDKMASATNLGWDLYSFDQKMPMASLIRLQLCRCGDQLRPPIFFATWPSITPGRRPARHHDAQAFADKTGNARTSTCCRPEKRQQPVCLRPDDPRGVGLTPGYMFIGSIIGGTRCARYSRHG